MKVGHASREIKEALNEAKKDIRNKNSMLDARYICGDRKIAEKFVSKFVRNCRKDKPDDYLYEIIEHQQARRKEKGNTVFLQAPDIKNGVGGLRDYQGILWMTKVKFSDYGITSLIRRGHQMRMKQRAWRMLIPFASCTK